MEEQWTTILKPKSKWYNINIKELFKYKDLIFLFVKRNYITRYKQTILGPLWLVINPVFTTIMYSIVFGNIAGLSTDGAPLLVFYLSGNIIWSYFALCINQTSSTFVNNAGMFGKVYFPRLVTPISVVMTGVVDFLIQFCLLIIISIIYFLSGVPVTINGWILVTPLLILQIALLGMGLGIIISSLTTKYRDLSILVTFGVQLWMYASPVVYPLSQIPEKYQNIYLLNPIAPLIEIFRYAVLGTGKISYIHWGISGIVTLIILSFGIIIFSHIEKTFMDTV